MRYGYAHKHTRFTIRVSFILLFFIPYTPFPFEVKVPNAMKLKVHN